MGKLKLRTITRGRPPNPIPQVSIRILPGSGTYCYLNVRAVELLMEKFGDRVRVLFDAKSPMIAFARESGEARCVHLDKGEGGVVFRWGNVCSLLNIQEPPLPVKAVRLDMEWDGLRRKATVNLRPLVKWSGNKWRLRASGS